MLDVLVKLVHVGKLKTVEVIQAKRRELRLKTLLILRTC